MQKTKSLNIVQLYPFRIQLVFVIVLFINTGIALRSKFLSDKYLGWFLTRLIQDMWSVEQLEIIQHI